ncbi:MAG: DegV family protein, partial [Clostridia bacterium]
MSVKLIIDSTADVAGHIKDRFTVVPLSIFFGEEEYVDGVTITHDVFYQKLIESDVMPSTSQATPGAFAEAFAEATADGSDVVAITISQKLSGTYQSAMIAA